MRREAMIFIHLPVQLSHRQPRMTALVLVPAHKDGFRSTSTAGVIAEGLL
jgi:hypothetical protein